MFTLIRSTAGSHLYGLDHAQSDRDSMGIGIATRAEKLGLDTIEQLGQDDEVTYELAKWTRLAVKGNPTVLQMLWTPPSMWLQWDERWVGMQERLKDVVLSERCRKAFIGYMDGQRKKLENNRGQRQELKDQFGYDTKFAAHMIRLGLQGIEVVTTGKMTLPMPLSDRQICVDIRHGRWTERQVLEYADFLRNELNTCQSVLAPSVNHQKVNNFLVDTYTEWW